MNKNGSDTFSIWISPRRHLIDAASTAKGKSVLSSQPLWIGEALGGGKGRFLNDTTSISDR